MSNNVRFLIEHLLIILSQELSYITKIGMRFLTQNTVNELLYYKKIYWCIIQ